MNNDQIGSLIRTNFKVIGTALAMHGLTQAAGIVNSEDFIGLVILIIGMISSHKWHADTSTPPNTPKLSALVALGAAALLFAGCASTPQQVAYRTAGTTVVSVDTAMNLWGSYVAANHPGTNAEAQVKNAFEKYQGATVVVCDAGQLYAAAGTNNAVGPALNQAIADAGRDLLDLENLLTTLGVKLQ